MSLTFNEIRLAALAGKTFTLTGVRIRELGIDENGIKIKYLMPNASNYQPDATLDFISIDEQPKHDPCRLFKKGDKVRVVELNGRCDGRDGEYLRGAFCKVLNDEEKNYNVHLNHNGTLYHIDPAYLELVTPVEEQYSVHSIVGDNGKTAFFAVRKGDVTVAAFFCDTPRAFTEEQALAAAEAERDRLNEEYRKEQE